MKILNFGSLNLDYVYHVPHFVRAGETLSSTARDVFPGGKGLNQSIALARAGGAVFHAGAVGRGDGDGLISLLRENGVDTALVQKREEPTGHAVIQVEPNGQNCILLHGGANRAITDGQIQEALTGFGKGDLLVLQNETAGLATMIRLGHARGMTVALNPSPIDESIAALPLDLVDVFLVNEVEAAALSGGGEEKQQLARLREAFPKAVLLMTLGGAGSVCDDGEKTVRCGTFETAVVDTTAAGDTFTGYFLTAWAAGEATEQAMKQAAKAAALAVSVQGAAPSIPTRAMVDSAKLRYLEPR